MLAVVLLYVGAVLNLNGIWLIGQTYEFSYLKINSKEIAIINFFTGGLGSLVALIAITHGGFIPAGAVSSEASGGYILLFAFTYIWVAINQITGADGRGLGWYSLFVAITAVPTGWLSLQATGGNPWLIWLGISWLAWAVLWFLFFLLLAMQKEISRLTGVLSILEGIFTGWLPAYLLFQGFLKFSG
jgi:hypothetical protein